MRSTPALFRYTTGHYSRGSILVLTLVLVGVLAITVAAMLSSVRHLTRSADDKIAEEECYQTALAGLNTVKAWLMQPEQATTHNGTGNTIGSNLAKVHDGALALSTYIYLNRTSSTALNMDASTILSYYDALPGKDARPLDGGRKIVYEWGGGANKPFVIRRGDANFGTPSTTLFNTPRGSDARSWVEKIKITTPYRSSAGSPSAAGSFAVDDLRFTSLIIEVDARTVGAGIEKQRTLSGKVLVIPEIASVPPATSGAAIVSGAGITVSGNSHINVSWGPVWSKKDMKILGLDYTRAANGTHTIKLSNNTKYTGVGAGGEKWVRYLAGSQGRILKDDGITPLFTNSVDGLIKDLFASRMNAGTPQLTLDGFAVTDPANPIFIDPLADGETVRPVGSGAFVQQHAPVDNIIDQALIGLDYTTWKNFAIANKGYARPKSGGGYVNATGQTLYVTSQKTLTTVSSGNTAFTEMKQVSMINLIPNDGVTSTIADRILFIDSQEGTENGATKPTIKFTASDEFFWKGMFFLNGHLDVQGAGKMPNIWAQNPDQYGKPYIPTDPSTGQVINNCIIDGILRLTGNAVKGGNSCIYGSIVGGTTDGTGDFSGGGSPMVYFNYRVKEGLFKGFSDPKKKGIVSGPIVELSSFL